MQAVQFTLQNSLCDGLRYKWIACGDKERVYVRKRMHPTVFVSRPEHQNRDDF